MLYSTFYYDFWNEYTTMASPVRFNYVSIKPIALHNKRIIKDMIVQVFSNENKALKLLSYIFCSDNYLLKMNKDFLNHDFFTDVISFDLSEGVETVGEVYISIDRVKENAILYSASFNSELLRVIFHGALHLCGYNDKKKSEITTMRQKEDYYLRLLQKNLL